MPTAVDQDPAFAGRAAFRYRPLCDADAARIHDAALALLEGVGLANAPAGCAATLTRAGARLGEDGRMRFPRGLVLDTVAKAARRFTLHGQEPRHDLALQGGRIHFGTAGAAVHFVDAETGEYRESLLADIYDAARVVDALANIHFFQRPMVARDMVDPADLDLNTLYACVAGTTKHVGTSFTVRENVAPALDLLHALAGGEDAFRARPFVSNPNPFVAAPLKFAANACGVLEACVEGGLPILLLSAGQAGTSAPAPLAGTLAQAVAEMTADAGAFRPGYRLTGVLVQETRRGLAEVLVGVTRDPVAGPVVTVGMGGILAEIYCDTVVHPAPVSPDTARRMLDNVRGLALLRGFRGRPRGDLEALADVVVRLSALATARPDVIEAEINPVLIRAPGEGVVAVDALAVVAEEPPSGDGR